jgi:catalase (peroxidase I)
MIQQKRHAPIMFTTDGQLKETRENTTRSRVAQGSQKKIQTRTFAKAWFKSSLTAIWARARYVGSECRRRADLARSIPAGPKNPIGAKRHRRGTSPEKFLKSGLFWPQNSFEQRASAVTFRGTGEHARWRERRTPSPGSTETKWAANDPAELTKFWLEVRRDQKKNSTKGGKKVSIADHSRARWYRGSLKSGEDGSTSVKVGFNRPRRASKSKPTFRRSKLSNQKPTPSATSTRTAKAWSSRPGCC